MRNRIGNFKTVWYSMRDSGELKKALELSIMQWALMMQTNKTKSDCYVALGGNKNLLTACFLCDEFIENDCDGCIDWNGEHCGENDEFVKWDSDPSKTNTKNMLNFLMMRLEELNGQKK